MNQFSSLGLSEPLLQVLSDLGFNEPTPIQAKAIPVLINARQDFIGLAQTGTGKTAAFGLPLIDLVDTSVAETQALVLAPTRELGQQIGQQLEQFSKHKKGLRVATVYGGAAITTQIRNLKKAPHILIATPGRLIDLAKRKALFLDSIKFVVLDEADEMLTMGFKDDLDTILGFTPADKHTWLFSATLSDEIRRISKTYMHDPEEVSVNQTGVVNKNIDHQFMILRTAEKVEAVSRFADAEPDMRAIVFCRTRLGCQDVAEQLIKMKYNAEALHGDMNQSQRDRVMQRFKAHSVQMLVATDVAARGIDVNDLTHVFHFQLPDGPEFYTHRSGRTARAGKTGISLALISTREMPKIRNFENTLSIRFDRVEPPSGEEMIRQRMQRWADDLISASEESSLPKDLVMDAHSLLAGISKEKLIEKLLQQEFGDLMAKDREKKEKKASAKKERASRDDDFSREDRKRGKKEEGVADGMVRFFINVGKMDQLSKQEMIGFLVNETGLKNKEIGNIDIKEKFTLFQVKDEVSKLIVPSFKNIHIGERELRVSRDDDGGERKGRGGRKFEGGKKSFGKPGGYKDKGGRKRRD